MAIKELIGKRIQALRKAHRLSQEQVAEKADISPNYLSRIECGKENPTLDMLIKLAHALEVEMWEIFDFGHEVNVKELREVMNRLLKENNEEKLRLAVKILRAVAR
ncbi:MAG: helix-turn-helix transcriptional regulator [Deltaproteobacteria bacterium]|nr:helix-turn-helix transcriptional regulator [Deltaproteobacteria bacterium]